jgi:hypothetical protein
VKYGFVYLNLALAALNAAFVFGSANHAPLNAFACGVAVSGAISSWFNARAFR